MGRSGHRTAETDRGASAVEFALVMPLLVLIVVGIVDFGVLFSQQLTLNNAVRAGARSGVVVGQVLDCPGIRSQVQGDLSGLAMDPSLVMVRVTLLSSSGTADTTPCGGSYELPSSTVGSGSIPCQGSAPGTSLVVEAQYPSTVAVTFPPFPSSMTLSAKAVYVCEFS